MKRKSYKPTRQVPLCATTRQGPIHGKLPNPNSELSSDEANELARKLNALSDYASQVNSWAQVEHATTMREYDFLLSLYGSALRRFVAVHAEDPAQGLSLPAGIFHMEEWPALLHIDDEDAALRWCRKHSNTSIDVTIKLNGSFEHILRRFMQKEFPFYLDGSHVFQSSVNLSRLRFDWREMESDEVPAGCSLEEAPPRLFVQSHPHKAQDNGGDDDDA